MKVDNPRFRPTAGLDCADCPFTDSEGSISSGPQYRLLRKLCGGWLAAHGTDCPTAESYAEACTLAENAQ